MKNGLLLALSGKFPMWEECLKHNLQFDVEYVVIRVDNGFKLTSEINAKFNTLLAGKTVSIFNSKIQMNKWNWKEELITNYHINKWHDTDYILFPDEDEKLPDDLTLEGDGQIMFDYDMVTDDGREVFKYPALPHSKAFKYHINLTYFPYFHFARVGLDGNVYKEIPHKGGNMKHYCFYKKEWEDGKIKSINERYPDYFAKFGQNNK